MGLWFNGQTSQYFTNDLFQSFNVSRKSYKYVNINSVMVVKINDLYDCGCYVL